VIAALKRHDVIDGAIRAPQPGAPFAYVTTRKFLEAFGLVSLRDLPDLERLKAEGWLATGQGEDELFAALSLGSSEDVSPGETDGNDARKRGHVILGGH
jgi:segregation and condensation protein B